MVLENEYLRYVIGEDGAVKSFLDKVGNKEYLSAEGGHTLMTITRAGKTFKSTSVSWDRTREEMTVGFGESGVTAHFAVRPKPHYITFDSRTWRVRV